MPEETPAEAKFNPVMPFPPGAYAQPGGDGLPSGINPPRLAATTSGPVKLTEVIDLLDKQAAAMQERLDSLCDKLAPLRAHHGVPKSVESSIDFGTSDMALRLGELYYRMHTITRTLIDLEDDINL